MNDKSAARIVRIEDSLLRLEAFPDKKDTELYIETNEAINEMESKV